MEVVGTATTAEMKENVAGLDTKLVVRQGNGPEVTMSVASRLLMLLAMDCQVAKGRPAGTWRSSQYEWLSLDAWAGEPLAELPADDSLKGNSFRAGWLPTGLEPSKTSSGGRGGP